MEQCAVSIQFPFDSLNLSFLLSNINLSDISLVGIHKDICKEEKFVKGSWSHDSAIMWQHLSIKQKCKSSSTSLMRCSKLIFLHIISNSVSGLREHFCGTWSCLNFILLLLSFSHIISQLEGLILKSVGLETCINTWENIFHAATALNRRNIWAVFKVSCLCTKVTARLLSSQCL